MALPLKKKIMGGRPVLDDQTDEMTKGPHAEPDEDEAYLDELMNEDLSEEGGTEDLFGESPLEKALSGAGFEVSPAQLAEIEAILSKKPATEKPSGIGGATKPAAGAIGGAVPGGMKSSDIATV